MAKFTKLTAEEYHAIEQHNKLMEEHHRNAIDKLHSVKGWKQLPWVKGMVSYHQNAISSIRWSNDMAVKRLFKEEKHGRAAV